MHTFQGRIEERQIESAFLQNNPLGDPHIRPLWIYTPPGYESDSQRRYPTIYLLIGWTGQIDMWLNRSAFRKNFPELADELFATSQAPPAILVYVDCWTSLGGSQYLDSPGTGKYHSYLCEEIVPWIDANYRTRAERGSRALHGKSSGGYGALVTAMLRPDLFSGIASHAGDALFEYCYLPGFPKTIRALREEYGGSYANFFADLKTRPTFSKPSDATLLSDWSMSTCYSANDDGTISLPYDIDSGQLIADVWQRWLNHDPVRMIPRHVEALRSMKAIYIDSGSSDDFSLDIGACALYRGVTEAGAQQVFFELFEGTHAAIEYRYPLSLRYLLENLD